MSVREDILQFLRAPQAFASNLPAGDGQLWRQGLEAFAQPQIAENAAPGSGLAFCLLRLVP